MRTVRVGPSAASATSSRPEPGRSVCQATACSAGTPSAPLRDSGSPSTTLLPVAARENGQGLGSRAGRCQLETAH